MRDERVLRCLVHISVKRRPKSGVEMKAFEFDHRLIDSYARFSRSFSTIRSDDLKTEIDRQYDAGRFWPDALLSLNPRYLQGPTVDDLVASGDLDEATGQNIPVWGDDPATSPPPGAVDRKGAGGPELCGHDRNRLGQVALLLCAGGRCNRPRTEGREAAADQRHHRLSDERTGQQPDQGDREVHLPVRPAQ